MTWKKRILLKKSIFAQWKCHFTLEAVSKGALQKLPCIELQFKKQMQN